MAWIESHEEIGDHWKTHKLAEQLNCNVPTAVGYMHLLWHYTLRVSWKTGDLSKFPQSEIARNCRFDGDCSIFFDALNKSKILDGMVVHDWKKYAKHIIYQRIYNEKRRSKLTAVKNLYNSRKTPATIPNLTIPNQTNIHISSTPPKGGNAISGKKNKSQSNPDFDRFWLAYPKKIGKGKALELWKRKKPPLEKCLATIERCKKTDNWKKDNGQFIPHPSTWLNQGRWDDEVYEEKKEESQWDKLMRERELTKKRLKDLNGPQSTPDLTNGSK